MCLSTPGRVTQLNGALAKVESEGRLGWYNALPQPDIQVGDYVLTHANLIVAQLEPEEAQEMFAALEETRRLLEQDAVAPSSTAVTNPEASPCAEESQQMPCQRAAERRSRTTDRRTK